MRQPRRKLAASLNILALSQRSTSTVRVTVGDTYYVHTYDTNWRCTCSTRNGASAPTKCLHIAMTALWMLGRDKKRYDKHRKPVKKRDWPAYRARRLQENVLMPYLIAWIADQIGEEARPAGKRGRKPVTHRDLLYMTLLKVWLRTSLDGTKSACKTVELGKHLSRTVHCNMISRFLRGADHGELKRLLRNTAVAVGHLDEAIGIDATGMSLDCSASFYYESVVDGYKETVRSNSRPHVMLSIVSGHQSHAIAAENIFAKLQKKEAKQAPRLGAGTAAPPCTPDRPAGTRRRASSARRRPHPRRMGGRDRRARGGRRGRDRQRGPGVGRQDARRGHVQLQRPADDPVHEDPAPGRRVQRRVEREGLLRGGVEGPADAHGQRVRLVQDRRQHRELRLEDLAYAGLERRHGGRRQPRATRT